MSCSHNVCAAFEPHRQQLLKLFGQLQPQWRFHTEFGLNLVNDMIRELEDLTTPKFSSPIAPAPATAQAPSPLDTPGSPTSATSSEVAKIAQGSQFMAHFEHLCGALVSLLAALAPSCGMQLLKLYPQLLQLLAQALQLRSQRPATMLLPAAPWRDALSRLVEHALSWVAQLSAAMQASAGALSLGSDETSAAQLLQSLNTSADLLLAVDKQRSVDSPTGVAGAAGVRQVLMNDTVREGGGVPLVSGIEVLQSCVRRCHLSFLLGVLRVLAGKCGDGGVNGIAPDAVTCRSPAGVAKFLAACSSLLDVCMLQTDAWLLALVQSRLVDGEFGIGRLRWVRVFTRLSVADIYHQRWIFLRPSWVVS